VGTGHARPSKIHREPRLLNILFVNHHGYSSNSAVHIICLAAELVAMADWLGLDEVVLGGAGDLAPALLSALAAADRPDLAGQVRVSSG